MNSNALVVGAQFSSYDALKKTLEEYQDSHYVLFGRRRSELLPGNSELKFRFIKLICKHGEMKRDNPKATGERPKQSTYKIDCPAMLYISVESKINKLVIRKFVDIHNHPCNATTYKGYPEKRRLSEDGRKEAVKLQKLKVMPSLIRPLLKSTENKLILSRDLANIKAKERKIAMAGRSEEEMLQVELNKITGKDPGACAMIDVDPISKKVNFILLQTSAMRHVLQKFPEVLITDITYKINKNKMPVSVIEVMDGNGEGRVVAYAFLCNEQKETLTAMFLAFVQSSGEDDCKNIKTVVVDKDFSEIGSLRTTLSPDVSIHLCLKHVDNNFKSAVTKEENKKQCLDALRGMMHSKDQDDFDESYKDLKELGSADLLKYFETNWLTCKEKWSLKDRITSVTYRNFTTNRVESHNRVLKMVLDPDTTLFEAVSGIVNIILENKFDDVRYRDHVALTKTVYLNKCNNPLINELYNDLTNFAAKVVHQQVLESEKESPFPDMYEHSTDSCSCVLFKSFSLPCRHIMRLRRKQGLPVYSIDIILQRWRKDFNVETVAEVDTNSVCTVGGVTYFPRMPAAPIKTLDGHEKFIAMAKSTQELNSIGSDCGTRIFHQRLQLLQDLKEAWLMGCEVAIIRLSSAERSSGDNGGRKEEVVLENLARHNESSNSISVNQPSAGGETINLEDCDGPNGNNNTLNVNPTSVVCPSTSINNGASSQQQRFQLPVVRTKGRPRDRARTVFTQKKKGGSKNHMNKVWTCYTCQQPAVRHVTQYGKNKGRPYLGCTFTTKCKGFICWEPTGPKQEKSSEFVPQLTEVEEIGILFRFHGWNKAEHVTVLMVM